MAAGRKSLPIFWSHAQAAATLPPHHGDLFDRMLVAQAGSEGMPLVSSDTPIARYDVEVIG